MAPGNQGRYGSGPRSQADEGPGGRREAPFGPEISWPYGFRQLDAESRDVLESAYGTGPSYQQPAMDDYGDPGYSDPSYEGPRTPYGGPAFPGGPGHAAAPRPPGGAGYRPPGPGLPGYHVPDVRDSSRPGFAGPGHQPQEFAPPSGGQEIWPVTGAQEALPDTGPQPAVDGRRGSSRPGSAAYPEQWYDNPRPGNPHPGNRAPEHRGADDVRPARPADRRLEGMTYGELRYDDPGHDNPGHDNPGHDEPLDDESWYEELRRSAPAYPQSPGGPLGPGSAPLGPGSGPQRRPEPRGPASGPQPGHPQAPDRAAGYGQPRWDGSGPERPQLNAGRPAGRGQPGQLQPGPLQSAQLQPAQLQPGPAAHGSGFLSAPAAPVGLLTPPDGTRVDVLRDGGAFPAAPAAPPAASPLSRASHALTTPAASRPGTAAVRPGHGLDGPEITSSWPVQPPADLETFEDFWRDDADEEYTGLFGDREAEFERADAKQAAASKRRTGRRRSGSNDRRLWLSLGGVVVVAAAAIVGVIKFEFPSHSGPVHSMAIPDKIGSYARTVGLEQQADLPALREKVIKMSSGEASKVVSAVYESGNSAAGNTAQIIMFIGGHLANADPAASIAAFTQQYPGAKVVSAGALGGEAACVQEGTGAHSLAMCAFFDDDSFGEVASPTMNAAALANAMRTVRPSVEVVDKN